MGVLVVKHAGLITVTPPAGRDVLPLVKEAAEEEAAIYGRVVSITVEPVLTCPEEDPFCPLYGYEGSTEDLAYDEIQPHEHYRWVASLSNN